MNEFETRIAAVDAAALYARSIDLLQVNVGLRCNMACAHCHQASSSARHEAMTAEIFAATLALACQLRPRLVDVTGGAPELHPRIREQVVALREAGLEVQVRTNLTALLEPGCDDLPELWARHRVRLLASLPASDPVGTDRQRGSDAFARSIEVLRRLNALGYGRSNGRRLDLASNPDGVRLPEPTRQFAARFRAELRERHGVTFDALLQLTNVPVGRLGESLRREQGRQRYLDALRSAFNPATVPELACRHTLLVAWDGGLYDCDFNLGAHLPVHGERRHVRDFEPTMATRRLAFGVHCFACTAAAGSS